MKCKRFLGCANGRYQSVRNLLEIVLRNRRISVMFGLPTVQGLLLNMLKRIENHPNGTTSLDVHIYMTYSSPNSRNRSRAISCFWVVVFPTTRINFIHPDCAIVYTT